MHPTRRDFLVGSASALLLDSVLAQTNDPLGKFMQEHQIAPSPREGAPLSSKNILTNTRNSVEGVIVVEKWSDEKFWLTYQEQGKEKLKTMVSTGRPQKDGGVYTPEGNFRVQSKGRIRYSRSYNNAPMPWFLHLHRGIFIHQGKVNGGMLSHGCIRVAKWVAEELYRLVPVGTPVIIRDTNPRR